MASIRIKSTQPYVEKVVQGKLNGVSLSENITIGVKVYSGQTLEDIREKYLKNLSTAKVNRWSKQLQELPARADLSDNDFEEESNRLEQAITQWNKTYTESLENFCKEHIAYIKNATLVLSEEGKDEIPLLVADSRDAKPIESLWALPDEALVVLLDTYLAHPAYKDSLLTIVPKLVFNTDFKDAKLGN